MSTIAQDPKGYYAILGLPPGADLDAIKAAYRTRVKAAHPDRNGAADAREEFQRIVEAYAVLKDVVARAEYDLTGAACLDGGEDIAPTAPFACCGCGKVTAQPRYVIFHQVKSWLVWAKTARVEGIFCRDCADRAAAKASTASWAFGWWSPPGLLLTPWALVVNLLGGTRPRPVNARVLIRQARAFLARGETDLAHAVADQAQRYATFPEHRRQVADLLAETAPGTGRFKDRWGVIGGSFVAQLLPLAALPATVAVFALIWLKPWDEPIRTAAGIGVQAATVGEMRHAALDALKVRQDAHEGSPVLALLDRFAAVQVVETADSPEWTRVRTAAGVIGYVPTRALYGGSGDRLRREWCAENPGTLPQAGEVLMRRGSGDNRIMIHNDGRRDAVVKLKTPRGTTVVTYFIPATYHIGVGGVPEGTYRIEFAVGSRYSRACGLFVDDMEAAQMPFTLTFHHLSPVKSAALAALPEITLITAPGDPRQPLPIASDRFLGDE
ncbi:MAG: DnaJ domain-containing protein [Magnetospirillum sp.]|nr:DnaJ domain-containing protein [Magnetospirillum sp.]